jgi:hypothetical protein
VSFLNSLLKAGLRLLGINSYRFADVENGSQVSVTAVCAIFRNENVTNFKYLGVSYTGLKYVGKILWTTEGFTGSPNILKPLTAVSSAVSCRFMLLTPVIENESARHLLSSRYHPNFGLYRMEFV